jgi:hypothetical protein
MEEELQYLIGKYGIINVYETLMKRMKKEYKLMKKIFKINIINEVEEKENIHKMIKWYNKTNEENTVGYEEIEICMTLLNTVVLNKEEEHGISGIIYAIIVDGYFYIGSTAQPILDRLSKHNYASKNILSKSKLYRYINNIRKGEWKNILYIILEETKYKSVHTMRLKEYEYIKKHINNKYCLNIISDIKAENMIKYKQLKNKK